MTPQQESDQAAFRAFVAQTIVPYADQYDREERLPPDVIGALAREKYLGALLPQEWGGYGMDMVTFGLLNEEVGSGCSSARSLLTVHSMVAHTILRWGTQGQKERWLPRLASGETIAAFALTEPNVGSDAKSVETTASPAGDGYILNGRKKWITFGQIADLFLVFAQCEGELISFLVERDSSGFSTEPISGLLGMRASMLAELHIADCRVPTENVVGRAGFGSSAVFTSALDVGRYSVAWGGVGIAQACLDACAQYTQQRVQFGVLLKEHELIREMMTNMLVNLRAARLLCYHAGCLKDSGDPGAVEETLIAKYFTSTTAMKAASDAVQIHGANGCGSEYPVQRYLRDAKIMEIIEGSTQIQQITIARYAYRAR